MDFYKDHALKVFQCLLKQTKEGEFCDVTVQVENEKFHAHKAVLVSCSEYFMKIFNTEEGRTSQIVVLKDNIGATGMREILNWIYSGKFLVTEENLFELLRAVSTMRLSELRETLMAFMLSHLSTANCFRFYVYAEFYSLGKAIEKISGFFFKQFDSISQQFEALRFDYDKVLQLISSDKLCVKEEKSVFQFLLKWTENDLEERRKYFPHLFKLVRLQFIPIDYVINVISKHGLVRYNIECRDEVDSAVSYHINPDVTSAQTPRDYWISNPRLVMLLPFLENHQRIYDIDKKEWMNLAYMFHGFSEKTIKVSCAFATKYPIAATCGGLSAIGETSREVFRFDGIRWIKMPSMKKARVGAAAVFFREVLFVFGGEVFPISHRATYKATYQNPYACGFAKSYEMFDNSWRDRLHPGIPRSYLAAQVVGDKVYLIGGYKPGDDEGRISTKKDQELIPSKVACCATTLFDPTEESWSEISQMRTARTSFACAEINSRIYVVGGYDASNQPIWSDNVEFLDVGGNLWITVDMSCHHCQVGSATGCVVGKKFFFIGSSSDRLNVYDPEKKNIYCVSDNLPRKGLLIPFVEKLLQCQIMDIKTTSTNFTCFDE